MGSAGARGERPGGTGSRDDWVVATEIVSISEQGAFFTRRPLLTAAPVGIAVGELVEIHRDLDEGAGEAGVAHAGLAFAFVGVEVPVGVEVAEADDRHVLVAAAAAHRKLRMLTGEARRRARAAGASAAAASSACGGASGSGAAAGGSRDGVSVSSSRVVKVASAAVRMAARPNPAGRSGR